MYNVDENNEKIGEINDRRAIAFSGFFVGIAIGVLGIGIFSDGIREFGLAIAFIMGIIRAIFFILENSGRYFKKKGYNVITGFTTGCFLSLTLGSIIYLLTK